MTELFLVERIDAHRLLCASELSTETVDDQVGSSCCSSGIYLYIVDERSSVGGITILARVTSTDSAFELFELFVGQHQRRYAARSLERGFNRRPLKRALA